MMGRVDDLLTGFFMLLALSFSSGALFGLVAGRWLAYCVRRRASKPRPPSRRLAMPGYTAGAAYDSGLAMEELHHIEETIRRELLAEAFDDTTYDRLMAMRFHRDTLEAQNSLTEQGESK